MRLSNLMKLSLLAAASLVETSAYATSHGTDHSGQQRDHSSSQGSCDNIPEGHDPEEYREHNNCT